MDNLDHEYFVARGMIGPEAPDVRPQDQEPAIFSRTRLPSHYPIPIPIPIPIPAPTTSQLAKVAVFCSSSMLLHLLPS